MNNRLNSFNENQKIAIQLNNNNILVSAGAGSGKTRVIIERIINILLNDKNISLNNLLIMTFTKKAANEMLKRIKDTFHELLNDSSLNQNIVEKILYEYTNIQNSNISTIHSFCKKVIDKYYYAIDLEPGYKLINDIDKNILIEDSIDEIIEEELKNDESNNFFNNYSFLVFDKKEWLSLYDFLISIPFYEDWIEKQKNENSDEIFNSLFYPNFIKKSKHYLELINDSLNMIEKSKGSYIDKTKKYLLLVKNSLFEILNSNNIDETIKNIIDIDFTINLKGGSIDTFDSDIITKAELKKNISNIIKEIRDDFIKKYYYNLKSYLYIKKYDNNKLNNDINIILDIMKKIINRYKKKKNQKALIDINDLEHFTLQIFYNKEKDKNGNYSISDIAKELGNNFYQIFIDEYQDSNRTQEKILLALSKNNLFMVGDIKQSIYRFRQAEPSIFKNKYDNYVLYNNNCLNKENIKLELNSNYRSTEEVINTVNDIFTTNMSLLEQSEIIYDDSNKLKYKDEESNKKEDSFSNDVNINKTEIHILKKLKKNEEEKEKRVTNDDEFNYLAKKINELISLGYKYNDIVILARSINPIAIQLMNILAKHNIPSFANTKSGFIQLLEIQTTINYLKIIDNPMQDIPLISILHSKIYNFSDDDLAIIRSKKKKCTFYESLLYYYENFNEEKKEICEKINIFLFNINKLRKKSKYVSVSDLIYEIYDTLNYYNIISLSTITSIKKANLDLLIQKAKDYENNNYTGLFNFIRYIENIEKKSYDEGVASIFTENDNLVQIMTIHSSKGLEFPIVILIDIDKRRQINTKKNKIIYDYNYGIGINYIKSQENFMLNTLQYSFLDEYLDKKDEEEYKRLFYVALTRAKNKIIMIGKGNENNNQSFYNMIIKTYPIITETNKKISINEYVDFYHIEYDNLSTNNKNENEKKNTIELSKNINKDDYNNKLVNDILFYKYPFLEAKIISKTSVSKIKENKKFYIENYYDDNNSSFINNDDSSYKKNEDDTIFKYDSKNKGTIIHRFFELFDYNKIDIKNMNNKDYLFDYIQSEKNRMLSSISKFSTNSLFDKEEMSIIDNNKIILFLQQELTMSLIYASKNNLLYREKSFMKLFPYNKIYDDKISDIDIIIQGVIDCFFFYNNKIYLIDYKTDKQSEKEYFLNNYSVQIEYYKSVLFKYYDIENICSYIYSYYNNVFIPI
ncbi:MAG: UvrD-helicase domain-containing protein [Eubacteriales bacterium]|nr:UvrD-helicase domain-containing protein [Eubacteriales bacterium]